jgi:putative tributyrin esterase
MKRRFLITAILAIIVLSPAGAQQRLLTDSLYAPSLQRTKRFMVLLPVQYDSISRYPVLYLLHGLGGDYTNWTTLTRIYDYSADHRCIIVMPDGEDSWYANSVGNAKDRFDDYLSDDLPSYVRQKYPIDTLRQGIAGLSMGGYGALTQAVRHPGRYIFAGSLSGSVNVPRDIEQREKNSALLPTAWNLKRIFGEQSNPARSAYDLLILAARANPDSLPYLYLAIGIQDPLPGFLAGHRDLVAILARREIAYEYHETPGAHTWKYWEREVRPLLARFDEVLRTGFRSPEKALESAAAGGDTASIARVCRALRVNPTYALKEDELKALGYRFLEAKKIGAAIAVFKLTAGIFPRSSNAYDCLGDAYLLSGDTTRAIENYQRSLEMNPANTKEVKKLSGLKQVLDR